MEMQRIRGRGCGPINLAPDDILLEIFKACTGEERPSFLNIRAGSGLPVPLILSHVCQLWRSIMFGVPSFWNRLTVNQPYVSKNLLSLLQAWLLRSRNLPIDFQLVATNPVKNKSEQLIRMARLEPLTHQAMMNQLRALNTTFGHRNTNNAPRFLSSLLGPVASGITTLALNDVSLDALTSLPRKAFPNLERLVLGIRSFAEWENFDWTSHGNIKAFAHTPSPLTHVALRRFTRSDKEDHIQLPWSQLTHFIDNGTSLEPCTHFFTKVLPSCAQLRHLSVNLGGFDGEGEAGELEAWNGLQGTVFPHLESLTIHSRCTDYPAFLRYFEFPALKTLRYSGHEALDTERWLQSGTFAHLEHLTFLPYRPMTLDTIATALRAVPALKTLEVAAWISLLNLLAAPSARYASQYAIPESCADVHLLPQLQSLTLRYQAAPTRSKTLDDIRLLKNYTKTLIKSRRNLDAATPESGLRAIHVLWAKTTSSWRYTNADYSKQLGDLVTKTAQKKFNLELTVSTVMFPWSNLDSLLRDEDFKGWVGLEELKEDSDAMDLYSDYDEDDFSDY